MQIGQERDDTLIKFYDSVIYGENEDVPLDCAANNECYCPKKNGFTLSGQQSGSKAVIEQNKYNMPFHKTIHPAGWGGTIEIDNVEFRNFNSSETLCGGEQAAIANSLYDSDYIPIHQFTHTLLYDVADDAFARFIDNPANWTRVS